MKLDEWGAESIYYILRAAGLLDSLTPPDVVLWPLLAGTQARLIWMTGTQVIRLDQPGCSLAVRADGLGVQVDPERTPPGQYDVLVARAMHANRKLSAFAREYRELPPSTQPYPTDL